MVKFPTLGEISRLNPKEDGGGARSLFPTMQDVKKLKNLDAGAGRGMNRGMSKALGAGGASTRAGMQAPAPGAPALLGASRKKRGQNIFATAIDMTVDFTPPVYFKSDSAIQFIESSLADNFIFASLNPVERRQIIDAMQDETVPEGSYIIEQGDNGDYFYIVEDGDVGFVVNGNHVGQGGRGAAFGELALLCKSPSVPDFA
jgi:hypothetical protein